MNFKGPFQPKLFYDSVYVQQFRGRVESRIDLHLERCFAEISCLSVLFLLFLAWFWGIFKRKISLTVENGIKKSEKVLSDFYSE